MMTITTKHILQLLVPREDNSVIYYHAA